MTARFILLDIEGTTSSIEFVYDVLFPYVRRELRNFLKTHWSESGVQHACELIAKEAGADQDISIENIAAEVFRLMDADIKSTGLKELQGLVSKEGYEAGKLRAHFYPDVPPALQAWTNAGLKCCVYSSGSIAAQRNFYRYANAGDLSKFISANFDTTTGPKREASSYAAIAAALDTAPDDVLFLSDVVAELNAAKAAEMQTMLVIRPGNKAISEKHGHRAIRSFEEIT
jgi:enolase-phosphatase E1